MKEQQQPPLNIVVDVILVEVEVNCYHPFNMPLLEDKQRTFKDQFFFSKAINNKRLAFFITQKLERRRWFNEETYQIHNKCFCKLRGSKKFYFIENFLTNGGKLSIIIYVER